jgi:hypothetical protein
MWSITPTNIITVICIVVLIVWFQTREKKVRQFSNALVHPTNCKHCEKIYNSQCAFSGQKSKCYSCEKQALSMSGGNQCAAINEHPMRYYESDPIRGGMGHAKMGYMG